jgi:festuclavine dehydrogenase
LAPIKAENKIYTATGDGLVPFVSASDIAAVAFRLLTDEKPPAEIDYRVVGPEELTHDQVLSYKDYPKLTFAHQIAAKLSKCLGREVVHVKLSEESAAQYMKSGMPEGFSKFMANIEVQTKHGLEAGLYNTVEKVTGRSGLTFDEWALENKERWN